MSSTWNGQEMWGGRRSNILDAAESALARAGITGRGCGLSAERVRALMAQEAKKIKESPPPPDASPKRKPRNLAEKEARNERLVSEWLAIPEHARSLAKFAEATGRSLSWLRVILREARAPIPNLRAQKVRARIEALKKIDGNLTNAELAAALGCDESTVVYTRKLAGLPVRAWKAAR